MAKRLGRALLITLVVFGGVFVVILGLLVAREGDLSLGANRVALVEVAGLIVDATAVVEQLEAYGEDPSIRAVVVRIQSPGGVVAPTQEIYTAIRRLRENGKKVVASMGSVAASGGYYLAAATDHIVANPGSLTGSIGVIMQLGEFEGLLQKVGVRYQVVKAGRFKDIASFARPMTDEERQVLQALLDDMYDQFVSAVAEGRGLEHAKVLQMADGRVYSGRRAHELKLVDSLGDLQEAIMKAADLAGISGKPRVVRPRKPFQLTDLLEWLLGSWTGVHALLPAGAPLPGLSLPVSPKLPLYLME